MNVAGIICEYNPFHLGHALHISKTRAALGNDCAIVCCMSGNFVQRGEFAVMSKHARAQSAVLCGADLVTELPLPSALSSAERFALGGVRALDALGVCGYISFGSESGDIERLKGAARARGAPRADEEIRRALDGGASYAQSLGAAYRELPCAAVPSP
ncbi:MAG: nucleotidyltransferase family protein, partial [Oscillospiraceae bacterium]|nr:nucleotidyltransferase family protein [Oscillospiraceae bacterium]